MDHIMDLLSPGRNACFSKSSRKSWDDKTSFKSVHVRKKSYALKYSKYTVKAPWRKSMGEVHLHFAGQNDCSVLWLYTYVAWNNTRHFKTLTYLIADGSRSITWLFLTRAHKLLGSWSSQWCDSLSSCILENGIAMGHSEGSEESRIFHCLSTLCCFLDTCIKRK